MRNYIIQDYITELHRFDFLSGYVGVVPHYTVTSLQLSSRSKKAFCKGKNEKIIPSIEFLIFLILMLQETR